MPEKQKTLKYEDISSSIHATHGNEKQRINEAVYRY